MFAAVFTTIAQFGNGFQPPVPNPDENVWTANLDTAENTLTQLESIISTIVGLITVAAGLFFVVNFVLAAFEWVAAGGDSGKITKARDKMLQSVIGLIIVIMAYAIIGLVSGVLGLRILNPAESLRTLLPVAP